jgi:hypothetical protein
MLGILDLAGGLAICAALVLVRAGGTGQRTPETVKEDA